MEQYYEARKKLAMAIEREVFEGFTISVLFQELDFLVFFEIETPHLSIEERDALHGLKVRAEEHIQRRLEEALNAGFVPSVGCIRLLYKCVDEGYFNAALYNAAFDAFTNFVNASSAEEEDEEGNAE